MEISSIVGHLLSGLACRAYAACFAVYIAFDVVKPALKPLAQVGAALN